MNQNKKKAYVTVALPKTNWKASRMALTLISCCEATKISKSPPESKYIRKIFVYILIPYDFKRYIYIYILAFVDLMLWSWNRRNF